MADLPIAHVIHSGGFYGAERMLLDHCRVIPGQHRVLFLDAPPALLERFTEAGVECHNLSGLRALQAHLRQQPVLLNAHNFKAQVLALLCAWRLGLPLVWTQHGFTPRSAKQKFYTWLSLRLCRRATIRRVACVAQSIAQLHRQAGVAPDKLQVIPNGLPEPCIPNENLRDPDAPLVGFVGRLSQEKGPDLFLDALIPLCRQRPTLKVVLLGDGPLSEALRQRIQEAGLELQILMPGYQSNMGKWMHRLSVLVLSSRTEGTPMILLEAMQAGTPIAAFAVGGIPDVIEHSSSGLLARPLDSVELAGHITELLDDPDLGERLGLAAQQRQRRDYHLPRLALRWQALYRAVSEAWNR
ncbi:glycosyltransferase family 4 protein [Pseudomonas chlororaphis]|uniref:Glycosyl transferase family 1 n=1 Tax=Pseudomonas chlororaphis TaxID=587753 RepID=A0A1Q8ERB7_9PSED|nr:glycosyltransferase family 4 protein [Pseudomonas chlororaphis]OLF54337.1 glycosyl transferase family 1 [Pseudomonas chlororaphis]